MAFYALGEGVGDLELRSIEDLKSWLRGKERQKSTILASRNALRSLPLILDTKRKNWKIETLFVFRAIALSDLISNYPLKLDVVREYADAAAFSVLKGVSRIRMTASEAAQISTVNAVYAAKTFNLSGHTQYALSSVDSAIKSARINNPNRFYYVDPRWRLVTNECTRLDDGLDARILARQPLWQKAKNETMKEWETMKSYLLSLEENWEVWINWYEDRLVGGGVPNGRTVIEELELERVMIPDEDWQKGPAHVNALIAEIEERYRNPKPKEEIPAQKPAIIQVEAGEDGRIYRRDPQSPTPRDEAQERRWESAWGFLRETLDDFLAMEPGRNNRALDAALRRYTVALSTDFSHLDIVKLGLHGNRLTEILQTAGHELMDDVLAELTSLLAAHRDFAMQIPEWRAYLEDIGGSVLSSDLDAALEIVDQLRDHDNLIDEELINQFTDFAEFVGPGGDGLGDYVPTSEDRVAISEPVEIYEPLVRDFVHSVGNLLSVVAKTALKGTKIIGVTVGTGALAGIGALAKDFVIQVGGPAVEKAAALTSRASEFEWLQGIINLLK